MAFVNPFNFVRFVPLAKDARQKPVGHEAGAAGLNSGRLTCRIVALSPMMIPSHDVDDVKCVELPLDPKYKPRDDHKIFRRFYHYKGDRTPVIPGSSLKGIVRSVAEALGNGCVSEFEGVYGQGQDRVRLALPPGMNACEEHDALCVTCRLFGMTTGEGGDEGKFYKGKVAFDDAVCLPAFAGKVLPEKLLPELSTPKPRHKQFYERNGVAAGRKFYYHRPDLKMVPGNGRHAARLQEIRDGQYKDRTSRDNLHRTATVRPVPWRTTFEFVMSYTNLTDEELALLVEALELEPNLTPVIEPETGRLLRQVNKRNDVGPGVYHKIGYGKPVGLGTAAIYIVEGELFDWQARYDADVVESTPLRGITLYDWVESWKQQIRGEIKPGELCSANHIPLNVRDLFCILRWPPRMAAIRYPEWAANEFTDYRLPEPGREPQ